MQTRANRAAQELPCAARAHVLLAAADDTVRHRRELQLKSAGLHVSVAATGFQAIVKASCHLPDIILLDPSLGESELDATRSLLATCPMTAHIPVVPLRRGRAVPRNVVNALTARAV